MALTVQQGNICGLRVVDAIASAANGIGVGRAGVAGAITRSAGVHPCSDGKPYEQHVRDQAVAAGFYDEGYVYVTESGGLIKNGIKAVMHAVTMKYPGSPTSTDIVEKCLHNLFTTAIARGFKSIAVPGMGTGIGHLDPSGVAKSTVRIGRKFAHELDIIVIDIDPVFVEAARQALSA